MYGKLFVDIVTFSISKVLEEVYRKSIVDFVTTFSISTPDLVLNMYMYVS
jgi:hypothetical protein